MFAIGVIEAHKLMTKSEVPVPLVLMSVAAMSVSATNALLVFSSTPTSPCKQRRDAAGNRSMPS